MKKIDKIIPGRDASQLISNHYAYWKFGAISLNFLLLLTAISIQSAAAAINVVSENPEPQLSASQHLKASSIVSELKSQKNLGLRQRLLASKQSHHVAQINSINISDTLTAKIEPETFNNSFSENNFSPTSQQNLNSSNNLDKQ